jgi:hypothetical protein
MPRILVFSDAGDRTWVVPELPRDVARWPIGMIKCVGDTFWNTPTRPVKAIHCALDAQGQAAAASAIRTRPHVHQLLTSAQHHMPDMVVFPPEFDSACAVHCALDTARFRLVDADLRQLTSGDASWFVGRYSVAATPANVLAISTKVHTEHHQREEELGRFKRLCSAFYSQHIVCVGRSRTTVKRGHVHQTHVIEVPLIAGAPTRLKCTRAFGMTKTSNLTARPGDILTTEYARTEHGWPMASKGGAQFRGLAPANSVDKLIEVTQASLGSTWISENTLCAPTDTAFRVPLTEVMWWLFGPVTCISIDGVVHTTMVALLSSGLGRDLITSHSIGCGMGTLAVGGAVTFTETELLRIGRSSFVTRWGQRMPDRAMALRPKHLVVAPALDHGTPPCMQTTALCKLPHLRINFRRDISATYTAIALARGVPIADVLPADLLCELRKHFASGSVDDLEKTFKADMKRGRVPPSKRCRNRLTDIEDNQVVACTMPSCDACAKAHGVAGELHLLTPASMVAGTGATAAMTPISSHYDLPLMQNNARLTLRRLKRQWIKI